MGMEMTREEIEKAKEYQFAKAAMERRWGDESPIEAFEEGAEYGYKFSVEKACDVLKVILEDFLHGGDSDIVIALLQEKWRKRNEEHTKENLPANRGRMPRRCGF